MTKLPTVSARGSTLRPDSVPEPVAKAVTAEERWAGRPVLGWLLGAFAGLLPMAASVVTGWAVGHAYHRGPGWPHALLWWAAVLGVSTAALVATDRLARKLLPLAALLRMSMVFPDRAPTRLAVARKAGSTVALRNKLEKGAFDDEPARAATVILSLAAGLNAHDRKTRGHSERVRALVDLVAVELHLDQAARDRLRWSALLHDIGKLSVHPDVLNKPGKLTDAEWEQIHRHPVEGARLARPLLPWLGEWALSIEQHHERWDGRGYPYGLRGEQISYGGRIVAVADSFETMTSPRSYKKALSPRQARAELARCAGEQFDPAVVRAFLNVSIGRLRWALGPLSWVAQLPLVGGLGHGAEVAAAASRIATGTAALAVTAAAVAPAALAPTTPVPDSPPAAATTPGAAAAVPTPSSQAPAPVARRPAGAITSATTAPVGAAPVPVAAPSAPAGPVGNAGGNSATKATAVPHTTATAPVTAHAGGVNGAAASKVTSTTSPPKVHKA